MQSGIFRTRRLRVDLVPLIARLWHSVVAVIGLLLLWQLACKMTKIPEYILPAPSAIASGFVQYWAVLGPNSAFSLMVTLVGLTIGSSSGVFIGILATEVELVRKLVTPVVIAIESVPKLALAPLLLLWFGYGLLPKVMLVSITTVFPLLVGTMAGFDAVDPGHLDLMRSLRASWTDALLKVRIPAAMPSIMSGLKIAATSAVVAAIVAEWVGSSSGLGYMMLLANSQLNTVLLFDALALLSGFGITLIGSVGLLEAIVLSWRPPSRRFSNERVRGVGIV